MAWPKGKPRPAGAGRKIGTPNQPTTDLFEICRRQGIDVFEEMVTIAANMKDPAARFSCWKEVAQYLYPKRRALEVSGDVDVDLAQKAQQVATMTTEDQIQLLETELKRLKGES